MAHLEANLENGYRDEGPGIPDRMTNRYIYKDRLVDKLRVELVQEFKAADTDKSNDVTFYELQERLAKINRGRTFDISKLRKLFKEMDRSGNGKVDIEEFWETFALKVEEYNTQIDEWDRKILEIRSEISTFNTQKQEVARSEAMNQFGIMEGSVLIVTVCEAKDIVHYGIERIDPFVMLQCEGQKIETSYKPDTKHPIWNEWFTFDIKRGDDPLRLTVYDRGTFSNSFLGKLMINLETLGTQQEVQSWFELHEENYDSGFMTGRIRLKLQWIYSRLGLMSDQVHDLQEHLKKVIEIKAAHQRELRMLSSPFDFIFKKHVDVMDDGDSDFMLSIYQSHPKEEKVAKALDRLFKPIVDASMLGQAFWSALFTVAFFIYLIVTLILWFFKPDFWNLSIVAISFYVLPTVTLVEDLNSPRQKKKIIRVSVFMIFLSFFYDIAWLIIHWGPWWGTARYDGDLEVTLRRFCLITTIVSLVLRLLIFLIYWRMSLDYFRFTANDMLRDVNRGREKVMFLRER
jgi:hypothetical protein